MASDTPSLPDSRDLAHLTTWVETEISGDINQEHVQRAMLALAATDPEYWWTQKYTNWIDFGLSPIDRDIAWGIRDLRDAQ